MHIFTDLLALEIPKSIA